MRRNFDAEFREGAVRIATETGKTVAEVARDPGINETTLAGWASRARPAAMERDVRQHCVIQWVKQPWRTRRPSSG
ncbi:transposase [Streptomyces coelicoflavus]|nr:transposase [Streptomyces coelicoflavus]